jgi:predicted DCC family thiol-disulfide oxidoreductase YuxK
VIVKWRSDLTRPDTVLFDGDCGICNESRVWLEKRDTNHRLAFVPFQVADLEALSPGLTLEMTSHAAYFVRSDGWRAGGARAMFLSLSRLPGLWGVIGAVGAWLPVSLLCEPFYRIVASNRSRISGWLGLTYCMVQGKPQRVSPGSGGGS